MKRDVRRYKDLKSMSKSAANFIAGLMIEHIGRSGSFSLVLSGGKTPRMLLEYLAETPLRDSIPWPGVHLFWGDERCVPLDRAGSNYLMAYEALLSKISLPPGNIHRIAVDKGSPEEAALLYDEHIRKFLSTASSFDAILLGVGADGHTASLFPKSPALDENERFVVAVEAPSPYSPAHRITMTLPAIGMADVVLFLAAGVEKEKVVNLIITDPSAQSLYPAARVVPRKAQIWFVADKGGLEMTHFKT